MQIIILNRQKKTPVSKRAIKSTVRKIFKFLKASPALAHRSWVNLPGQLTVIYTDNRTIQELNHQFLGENRPTDVLCFDLSEGGRVIADIVISLEKAHENCRRFNTSASREARLYLVHGILHLIGYNDRRKKDRIRMHRKALQILKHL